MEAIFRDGSRQYKVSEGSRVEVDFREAEPGTAVEFSDVLYLRSDGSDPVIGRPRIDGARVVGKVLDQVKGPKLIAMSFRRRKNSKSRVGHRQKYTRVEIERIETTG